MLFKTALVQVALGAAVEDALEVRPALRVLVDLQVLLQVASRRKLLGAVITLKRLLARVDTLVPDQIGDLAKCLVASWVVALVRLLLIMHPCVFLKR